MTGLAILLLLAPAADPVTEAWPGFRGRGGSVSDAADLPVRWSESENLAWRADLPGYGQSSPVVWGGTVYLTAVEGENREKGYVLALDARTGKERWRHAFEPTQKARWSNTVSRAAPTPVADTDGVYCFFEGGNLVALTHGGKVRWERSLVKDYGEFQGGHGLGSSPAQTTDTVFVLVDHRGPSYLLAVDKATGKTRWKADRDGKGSWTSPVIALRDGRPEVVVSSNGSVCGYEAGAGKELWRHDGLAGNTLPSASVAGDLVLFGGSARQGLDPKAAGKSNGCLRLVAKDAKPGYEVAWTAREATASYASPLAYRGCGYFVSAVGVVYCLDLKTGREHYAERIAGPCWASPVGASGHVYFFGRDGRTAVLKAGAEFDLVATNRLWDPAKSPAREPAAGKGPSAEYDDPIVYGVAAADRAFFVRTGTALYRVGKP